MSRMTDVDPARMLAGAAEIAFPRYPGSAGDRRAIALVAAKLRERGLETVVEPFRYDLRPALVALRVLLVGAALAVGAATALAHVSAPLALVLLATGVAVGGLLIVWAPGAARLYARSGPTQTANVAGYRRARHPRLRIVLLAHHDSKSQNLTFPVRMGLTLASLAGGATLALTLVVAAIRAVPAGWLALAAGGATVAALLGLATLRSGNDSPGGVDNAGSVAIVLELAGLLPSRVADDVELIFLSPGAEEDHMVGAMRWLAAHRAELVDAPLYALNFDGAGAPGKVVLIERYGLGRPFSADLSAVARTAAGRLGIPVRGITMPPAIGIDAIPFAHHALPCLTLSSGALDRATISVHSARDVAAHLDGPALERVARLALEIVADLVRRRAPPT